MDLQVIRDRIVKAEQKLEKLFKKKERITIALNGGKNPYYYDESSMRACLRDIKDCQDNIQKLRSKLALEEKRLSMRIPVIEEFLNRWGLKAFEFYNLELNRLREFNSQADIRKDELKKQIKANGINPNGIEADKILDKHGLSYRALEKDKRSRFSSIAIKLEYDYNWKDTLNKIIEREKENKRNMLMERVMNVTGRVTDARQLFIADNGEINGIVIGENGSAKINTIYAGGYNIQCLHFRVLVHEVNR